MNTRACFALLFAGWGGGGGCLFRVCVHVSAFVQTLDLHVIFLCVCCIELVKGQN